MGIDPLNRLDAVIGDAIETTVRRHHQRRLRRLGWSRAFADDERPAGDWWAAGEPAPRPGTTLEVLIDGAEALPAIAAAIAGARRSVWIAGWHLAPHFELVREDPPVVLGHLLAATVARGVDVRVLLWSGAPVPAFHPTRKEVAAGVETLVRQTGIRCATDPREHPVHCHHEKAIVVDGELAFVGGIDLTDYDGDRYDHGHHPARRRKGWHDVATRLRGPAVTDVADHFRLRWLEVTGEPLARGAVPDPIPGGGTVQVVRTVAESMYEAVPTATSGSSRATCGRCAAPSDSSTWRTSSCGRPRSCGSWSTSCAARRATTSGSSCCCRPRPTTARTTPRAS